MVRTSIFLAALVLITGCSSAPQSMSPDQLRDTARSVVAGKIYVNSHAASLAWGRRAWMMLMHKDFAGVDKLCRALESRRSEAADLCGLRALLPVTTPATIEAEDLWNVFVKIEQARQGRAQSDWLRVLAALCECDRFRGPLSSPREGPAFYMMASDEAGATWQELAHLPDTHPGSAATRAYLAWSASDKFTYPEPMIPSFKRNAADPNFWVAVGAIERHADRTGRWGAQAYTRAARALMAAPEPAAPLYLAENQELLNKNFFELYGWKWDILKPQFERALAATPKSAALRNAMARCAWAAGDKSVALEQLRFLGWQADVQRWSEAAPAELLAFNEAVPQGDFALKVGAEGSDPENDLVPQCKELLEVHKYALLEAVLDDMRHNRPAALEDFYAKVGSWDRNSVRSWHQAHPSAASAQTSMALSLLQAAWEARGSGYSDSVTAEGWASYKKNLDEALPLAAAASAGGCQDPALLELLVTLEMAGRGDAEKAFGVVSKSVRGPLSRDLTLRQFTQLVAPRWHGQPGDLGRYADRLRTLLGHDQAYAKMAGMARFMEGLKCFDPDGPARVDWSRWQASYAAARKAGALSVVDKADYLQACILREDRASFAAAVDDLDGAWWWDYVRDGWTWDAWRAWGSGRSQKLPTQIPAGVVQAAGYNQPEDPRATRQWGWASTLPGTEWLTDPKAHFSSPRPAQAQWVVSRRVPCKLGVEFGFDLKLPQPLSYTFYGRRVVLSPPQRAGRLSWNESTWYQVYLGGQDTLKVRYHIYDVCQLVPGTWTVKLLSDDTPARELGRCSFQLYKP